MGELLLNRDWECPDYFPEYFCTPDEVLIKHVGGTYLKRSYSDGVIAWINEPGREKETHFPNGGLHYDIYSVGISYIEDEAS